MIDLHTHTIHSDGTETAVEMLENAEKLGLKALSITDHISCGAYEELENVDIKKHYTGKLITGCELFTTIERSNNRIIGL